MSTEDELKRAALILEIAEAISSQFRTVGPVPPEFFPLPQRGPAFWPEAVTYYDMEKRGVLMLVRLRKARNQRGRVLVPYQKALAAIRKLANA